MLTWCPTCKMGTFTATTTGADAETLIEEPLTPEFLGALDLTQLVVQRS